MPLFADSSDVLLLVSLLLLRIVLDDRFSGEREEEDDGWNKCCVLMFRVARRICLPPTKVRTNALRKIVVPRVPYEAISAKRIGWKADD